MPAQGYIVRQIWPDRTTTYLSYKRQPFCTYPGPLVMMDTRAMYSNSDIRDARIFVNAEEIANAIFDSVTAWMNVGVDLTKTGQRFETIPIGHDYGY